MMKLISLNLRFDGQSRTDAILNYINNQKPDILVFGEFKIMQMEKKSKKLLKQKVLILKNLKMMF